MSGESNARQASLASHCSLRSSQTLENTETKLAALAKLFDAPFGREHEARCARQTIRCSLRSHTTTNEARCARHPQTPPGFGLFFSSRTTTKNRKQKSEIRCSLRSRTQSGHFLSITDNHLQFRTPPVFPDRQKKNEKKKRGKKNVRKVRNTECA